MTVPGTRPRARKTLRATVLLGVLLAGATAGAGIVTAAPTSPIPPRLSQLSAEQQSWRDSDGVIWCPAHPQFPGCKPSGPSGPVLGYRYPAEDTAFTVWVRIAGGRR
ncbi:hypothetical protein DFR70_12611 [Nocardia tenerifensis]|uniref:Uncharacterized protein n=1 Tax=Nocardia tenerifensis TaxID=228006 RepID=A0A318JSA1_9NOCA|nr:hypothetical protein [Nocardia tenerifensis]PXX53890.1 hypothetical protein DFR70_12611 [Nocardia tenerifensis]